MKKLLWLLLLLPFVANATTPTFDTTNYFSEPSSSSTTSYTTTGSLTVTSASNLLICTPWAFAATVSAYASVTWGGASLSLLSGGSSTNLGGVNLDIWYLINPTPGTHTLTATYPTAMGGFAGMLCIPVDNANVTSGVTSAFGTPAVAGNNVGGSITVTATGSAGASDVFFGAGQVNGSSIISTGTSQSRIGTAQSNSVSEDQIAGTVAGVFAWTNSGSSTNANAVAVVIHGTSAGGSNSAWFLAQ